MKIAIIGAGFTGLSAAYYLTKKGFDVTIFEKDDKPGGLAIGYKEKNWEWSLEQHYHHLFTNDKEILNLAKEIGQEIIIKKPKTSVFVDNGIYQLDSPLSLLNFKKLNIIERMRMGLILAFLKYNSFWKPLEKIKAANFLEKTMGREGYQKIWEPLLVGKFGEFSKDISLAWFWARIKKRTTKLAYPKGGFLNFANLLSENIKGKGCKFFFSSEVINLENNKRVKLQIEKNRKKEISEFDKVIVTLPSFLFLKFTKNLPIDYQKKLNNLKGLGATNLVLRLKDKFFDENTYWLSISQKEWPFLAVVEHTNFMDIQHYNNEHLLYIGNYLPVNHPFMKMTKEELLKIYTPYLKKINPNFELCILNFELFKSPFAQPVIPINYSKIIPPFKTPLENVYLANIEQVYPWDRGTNYAVELGRKIAEYITE